jgi:hypothetical protein
MLNQHGVGADFFFGATAGAAIGARKTFVQVPTLGSTPQ